jgi:hypothetical protein
MASKSSAAIGRTAQAQLGDARAPPRARAAAPRAPPPAFHVGRQPSTPPPQRSVAMRAGWSGGEAGDRPPPPAFPPPLPPLDDAYEAATAFSAYANWLIPGRLMAGRYPYVEPNRCTTRAAGDAQLVALVGAGVTTFVSLQAELPPQGEMSLAGVGGFLPYRATATLVAAAAAPPPSIAECGALRTPQLNKFLPPRTKAAAAAPRAQLELEFLHCPITDLSVPGAGQLAALVADLAARLRAGEVLYLHCWGGRGRAGVAGAALLAELHALGQEEALERVARAFATRRDVDEETGERYTSPQTEEQREFVRTFVARRRAAA